MKLYNNFIRTFTDLPNHTTLLLHSLSGCPLKCFGCHNYDEIIANTPKEYKTTDDLYDYLKKNGFLFDAAIFSGGEFLINPLDEVRALLQQVRKLFDGKLIVTTSGIYHQKVRTLYEENLVDGIHIDMKLPYHVLDVKEDAQIYKDIMGITPSKKVVDQLIASVDAVIEHNSILDQVRTVRYPLLDEAFFTEIRHYVEERKAYHGSIVPYFLNEFVYLGS
ncbi:4Fe-4S cluster-binding domain-containing protein [Neobacillus cucumis]|uniref:4Fe-4S cluster-binding domain-containing protein n=1 Tax=Neobacillus cucumis TaxID=1740721 RepID=UPI0018DF8048|nr:4Fe-4S cluster-binding domain-containing protein [Neobacillus cucumis]MBI0578635.1 4Fe-4S cluster-binding domain-containing protein [Neobacillus cucumis]